jgi:hypothetical protein
MGFATGGQNEVRCGGFDQARARASIADLDIDSMLRQNEKRMNWAIALNDNPARQTR